MSIKKTMLIWPVMVAAFWTMSAHAVDISGYFDMEYKDSKNDSAQYRQHHLNIMFQHEVSIFRFFSEIEFEDAPDIDVGARKQPLPGDGKGRLFVERAYAQALFSKHLGLTMGQMLHSSLYYENHYPSIIYNIETPTHEFEGNYVFERNLKGVRAGGEIMHGAYYDVWTGRGPAEADVVRDASTWQDRQYETGTDMGYKLGYQTKAKWGSVDVSYLYGDYTENNRNQRKTSTGFDVNLTVGAITLWAEMASSSHESGSASDQTASYAILSYAHDLGSSGEIFPYVMLDNYKRKAYTGEKKTTAFGVAYRPVPQITAKIEVMSTDAYRDESATSIPADDSVALAFVYFYN